MSKRRTYYLRISQFWKLAALRGNETLAILLIWVILLKKRDVYDFGRVFFSFSEESKTIPDKIYFQPLGNHVANVRRLVKLWNIEDFSGNNEADKLESKKRVREATKIECFIPFVAAYFHHRNNNYLTLEYYTQENIYIPVSLVDLLKGEIHV